MQTLVSKFRWVLLVVALLALALASFSALQVPDVHGQSATATPVAEEEEEDEGEVTLATATTKAYLAQPGRAILSARGNHWIFDSVPPLGSPSEEVNPLDAFLGSLGTCFMFIYETASMEQEFPLESIYVTVEGDLAPQGVRDGSVNPRLRAFRVHVETEGLTAEQAEFLNAEVDSRCPIYNTLIRSAPIDVFNSGLIDAETDEELDEESEEEEESAG